MHTAVQGRRRRHARRPLGLLVAFAVTSVALGLTAGAAGATDASAGACIKAHPPSLSKVGPTSATIDVEYNDDCAFPAKVGVKLYRPNAAFLRETTKTSESTKGAWKTASFTISDLPTDKLFRVESSVENFGTDFSSFVEFQTAFTAPNPLTLQAIGIRGTPHERNQAVDVSVTASGLLERPPGTTQVTLDSSLDGRPLETVAASFQGCFLQERNCVWVYRIEGVPWGAKLGLSATFDNVTYAEGFPNRQTTKSIQLVGGDSKACRATVTKSECPG